MSGRLVDYRRVFVTIAPAGDKLRLVGSLSAPITGSSGLALVSKGMLPGGDVTIDLPMTALKGDPGDDAYQVARANGYGGTRTQWLASLVGVPGKSAYELARDAGYGGTQTQWLATLRGEPGLNGKDASATLGSVTLAETATVAIAAGTRRRTITVPASLGLAAGDILEIAPKTMPPTGYLVQPRCWALSATQLQVELTVPLIAIGGSYSIDCWLLRFRAA